MTKLTLEQHEFDVLKGIIDDRLNSLKKNIAKHSDNLDEYESNIKNYTTYDLHVKLSEVKWWNQMKWATDNSLDGMYK